MGRTVRLAHVLRRAAGLLDAGRRFVSRPRQLERYGHGRRWQDVHVGPGDDLALAAGVPARLRRAHGLDGQGPARSQPQPGDCREWSAGTSASTPRRGGRGAPDARRHRYSRSRRPHAEVHLVLLSRSGHRDSRSAGVRRWSGADRRRWGGGGGRHSVGTGRRPARAAGAGDARGRGHCPRDCDPASRRHRAHHPGRRGRLAARR